MVSEERNEYCTFEYLPSIKQGVGSVGSTQVKRAFLFIILQKTKWELYIVLIMHSFLTDAM